MFEKEASILKVLADLGLHKEEPLTVDQERQVQLALDPEEKYYDDLIKLFSPKSDDSK